MNEQLERLRLPLYLVALTFVVGAAADMVANNLPTSLGDVTWRIQAVVTSVNYLVSPLFGAALAAVVAASGRPRTNLLLGILWSAGAALLLGVTLLYLLDFVQALPMVRADLVHSFKIGAGKNILKLLLAAGSLAAIGVAQLRTWRRLTPRDFEAGSPAPLVREHLDAARAARRKTT